MVPLYAEQTGVLILPAYWDDEQRLPLVLVEDVVQGTRLWAYDAIYASSLPGYRVVGRRYG